LYITPIVPRVSETDGTGHINNVFVPIWFESGRREIFRLITPDLRFDSWRVALVNMNVDYEGQIFFQEEAEVRTWTAKVGTKSFTIEEEVWQGDRRCARGTAVYVYFNYDTQTSETIPQALADALKLQCASE
jgi:acyl-CoA thioester hydrolase